MLSVLTTEFCKAKTHSPRQPRFALQPAKREWRWAGVAGGANEKTTPFGVVSVELPQQFRTFAYKIEYSLPSSQKLTLLLSEPKKFQGQRRYPDLQAFGKKS